MTADELASTTITVDGKLSGDYVDPVETALRRREGAGLPVGEAAPYVVDEIQSAHPDKQHSPVTPPAEIGTCLVR